MGPHTALLARGDVQKPLYENAGVGNAVTLTACGMSDMGIDRFATAGESISNASTKG